MEGPRSAGVAGKALGLSVGGPGAHREGVLSHCLDHVSEEDLGGEGVAVIDDRLTSWPLPAVQLHTATTRQEHLAIHLDGGVSSQLASCKMSIK